MAFNPFDIQALFAKQAARPAIGQGQQRQVVDSGPVRRAPVASQQNETAGSSAPNMMGSAAFGGSGGMDKAEGKPSGDGLSFGDRLVGAAIGMSNPGALPGYFKGIQDRRNAALSNQRTMAYLNQMDPESAQLVQAGILSGAQALQRYEAKMQQQQAEQRRRDFMAQVKGIQTTGQMGQPQQQAPAPVPEGEARAQIGVGNSGMTEPAPVQQGGQNGFGADPANLMKMRQQLADYAPFAPDDQSRAYVQDRIALIDSQIAEANKRAAPTDDLREYEYAKKQGYNGTFRDFMLEGRKAGAMNINMGDNPNSGAGVLKELDKGVGNNWTKLLSAGDTAAGVLHSMSIIEPLLKDLPSGPITGRFAERFPGFSDSAAVFNAQIKPLIPSLRVEGSGSTSDIEFAAMEKSWPSLVNRPEANAAIVEAIKQKAQINLRRAEIISNFQMNRNDEGAYQNAQRQLNALNRQSVLSPELRSFIGLGGQDGAEQATAPAGDIPAQNGIQAGQIEDGYRFLGGDPADQNSWEKVQ